MLSEFRLEESKKWNEIVESFKEFDVYYLAEYTKAFQIHGDGEPILLYYNDDNIKAINVAMKRDIALEPKLKDKIPLHTYYDLVTTYGYGGFLIEGEKSKENLDRLFKSYNIYCLEKEIISEFVRFHPLLLNNIGLESYYNIFTMGRTVSIELKSEDYIWDNLTSKNRNVIRKAKKNGVEIYWGRSNELMRAFEEMYNKTMDKDNADEYYYFNKNFYQSLLNDLKYNSLLFYAVFKGKIIAMSMIMFSNKRIHYHLSASEQEFLRYAPTNLLLYEVACWGANNGYEVFHLGGGLGGKEDSLYRFKKAFNRNEHNEFSIGKKIFNQEIYDELIGIRKDDDKFDANTSFFPAYRG